MVGRFFGALFNIIGLLALTIVAGVAGATAFAASVPTVRESCTQGPVCLVLDILGFPDAGKGGTAPAPAPSQVACLTQADGQQIYRLAEVLVLRDPGAPLNFGAGDCIPAATVVSTVCEELVNVMAEAGDCDKLKPSAAQ